MSMQYLTSSLRSHVRHDFCVILILYTSGDLTEQYMADARAHIRQNGVAGIEEFLKKKIDGSKSVTIRFGIVGNCGAGKSAFINAMRG